MNGQNWSQWFWWRSLDSNANKMEKNYWFFFFPTNSRFHLSIVLSNSFVSSFFFPNSFEHNIRFLLILAYQKEKKNCSNNCQRKSVHQSFLGIGLPPFDPPSTTFTSNIIIIFEGFGNFWNSLLMMKKNFLTPSSKTLEDNYDHHHMHFDSIRRRLNTLIMAQ